MNVQEFFRIRDYFSHMKLYVLPLFLLFTGMGRAQHTGDTLIELPFHISNIKKLDSLELAQKREGTYVTGVPDISIDPLNGFGYGAEGFYGEGCCSCF